MFQMIMQSLNAWWDLWFISSSLLHANGLAIISVLKCWLKGPRFNTHDKVLWARINFSYIASVYEYPAELIGTSYILAREVNVKLVISYLKGWGLCRTTDVYTIIREAFPVLLWSTIHSPRGCDHSDLKYLYSVQTSQLDWVSMKVIEIITASTQI